MVIFHSYVSFTRGYAPHSVVCWCQNLLSDDSQPYNCECPEAVSEIHICLVVTGTMECYDFPFSWEFHNSKWRTPSFVGGVANNHQPDTILYHIYIISYYTMLYQCLVNWENLVSIHPFLPVPIFFLLARDAADVVRPEASILWSTPWEWPWFRSRGRRTGPGLLPQLPS